MLPLVTRVAAAADVARCLDDPDPEVRVAACEALARIGAITQVAPLFECLTDDNPAVVQASVAAIQALGVPAAKSWRSPRFATPPPACVGPGSGS